MARHPTVLTVVGNRPQFVKAAAVSGPLRKVADEILVHTGQHHDPELSDVFFTELAIPKADEHLAISGGNDDDQVDRMIEALMPLVRDREPDWVLVYGDTNSTLAGARAADECGVPVAHVEAGMRSFDLSMPEERNRIATDRISSLLLCSTPTAVGNIADEGLTGRVELVGDVMADVVSMIAPRVSGRTVVLEELGLEAGGFLLVTAHRAGNVDTREGLEALLSVLGAQSLPMVFPLHPRTASRIEGFGLRDRLDAIEGLMVTQPLGYVDFQSLLANCRALLTDSGGAQKEAFLHGVQCVTLRDTTEWVETVESGWNSLTGLDPQAVLAALARPPSGERPDVYGDARAGSRVAEALTIAQS